MAPLFSFQARLEEEVEAYESPHPLSNAGFLA